MVTVYRNRTTSIVATSMRKFRVVTSYVNRCIAITVADSRYTDPSKNVYPILYSVAPCAVSLRKTEFSLMGTFFHYGYPLSNHLALGIKMEALDIKLMEKLIEVNYSSTFASFSK